MAEVLLKNGALMNNNKDPLLKEYHERQVRWGDRALDQLSVFNNLLITLGVGFLAFAYKSNESYKLTSFSTQNIDWALTLVNISTILIYFSIVSGLFVAINRLWDFRITRRINHIRQNAYEHASKTKLNQSHCDKYSTTEKFSLYKMLIFDDVPDIPIKSWEEADVTKFKEKFEELRSLAYNLGLNSWTNLKLQTTFLFFGITVYVIVRIFYS